MTTTIIVTDADGSIQWRVGSENSSQSTGATATDRCVDKSSEYVGQALKAGTKACVTQSAGPLIAEQVSPYVDAAVDACTKTTGNIAKSSFNKSVEWCVIS